MERMEELFSGRWWMGWRATSSDQVEKAGVAKMERV
jgi:hypothetical protein